MADAEEARERLRAVGFNTLAEHKIPRWLPDPSNGHYDHGFFSRERGGKTYDKIDPNTGRLLFGGNHPARIALDKIIDRIKILDSKNMPPGRRLAYEEFDDLVCIGASCVGFAYRCYGLQRLQDFIRLGNRGIEMLSASDDNPEDLEREILVGWWLRAQEIQLDWSKNANRGPLKAISQLFHRS